ncbi:MAG: ATP-binding protein [Verrucomicrobiota bacterium]
MNSFRLRLALLAGATTAALLFATGFIAWELTISFSLDRVDRELRRLAHANLQRIGDESHWGRVNDALAFVSGSDRPPSYVLWVKNYDREEYRSPGWPAEIFPEKFSPPTTYEGGLTFTTPPPPPRRVQISPENPALPNKIPYFLDATANGSTWRVGVLGNPYTTLVLAANLDELNQDLQQLRYRFLAAVPVALLLVGGGAWFFASRALRPVATLTRAAERVTARGLDQRIADPGHDREFQRLVTVFNEMMDRLEKSFHQATRFSADASHELKTPLALLQLELEQALSNAPPDSTAQHTYLSLLEEVHRLTAIVQKLLLLSLADSGRLDLRRDPADLSQLVTNVIEDCTALAPTLRIEQSTLPSLSILADSILLEQALQNLAGNAIKYNREGGTIRFTMRIEGASAVVSVGNTGRGIGAEDRARVFERFYRSDPARTRDLASGVGLGLSLSREILRAHGGDLALAVSQEDWTEFVATVPLAPDAGGGEVIDPPETEALVTVSRQRR